MAIAVPDGTPATLAFYPVTGLPGRPARIVDDVQQVQSPVSPVTVRYPLRIPPDWAWELALGLLVFVAASDRHRD